MYYLERQKAQGRRQTTVAVLATRVSLSALSILLSSSPALDAQQKKLTLDEVMRRAHTYVAIYEDHQVSSLVAREEYKQVWQHSDASVIEQRTLHSEYMVFQLPPSEDWFALRDVLDVNGVAVADREVRLKMLFTESRDKIEQLAMAIDKESARFNIGDVTRTVNLPTFPLRFLRPANRKRFDFNKEAEEQVGSAVTWVVAYKETQGPTFTATTQGRDVPASGRFWIDPETGAVLRTEMILGGSRRLPQRATVTVTYALDPTLGFRVPIEMREKYDNARKKKADVIIAVATYSDFRPFDFRSLR
jgi:hypothetical protein